MKFQLFNIWSYPKQLIEDIRIWFIIRKILNDKVVLNLFKKNENELRIDKLYRIYTVYNIPEELTEIEHKDLVDNWLLNKMRDLDDILLKCGLSDLVYPTIQKIDMDNTYSFLLKLIPITYSISIYEFLKWLFNIILWVGLISSINKFIFNIF